MLKERLLLLIEELIERKRKYMHTYVIIFKEGIMTDKLNREIDQNITNIERIIFYGPDLKPYLF